MTVSTFYPSEDGHVRNVTTNAQGFTAARDGSLGTKTVDTSDTGVNFKPWGSAGTASYYFMEDFFAFDTSSIPDGDTVSSVVLSLNIFADNTATVTNVCEVRAHSWTAPIVAGTWVPGASLSAKTLLATATSAPGSRFTVNAYKDFTSTGSFAGYINKTGLTQVMVVTDRMTAGTAPTDDETIHPYFVEHATVGFRPKLVVTHAASAGGFVPTNISGCKAWWDFSDLTTLFTDTARTTAVTADGQTIGGVTDKSGAGLHLSQSTASRQATYKTAIVNGKSVAPFDGTLDLYSPGLGADTSWTIFITAKKQTAPTSSQQTLFSLNQATASIYTNSTISSGYLYGKDQAASIQGLSGTPTAVTTIALNIASASSMTAYRNGTQSYATFDPNDAITTGSIGSIGGESGAVNMGDYDICEIVAYNSSLSGVDMNSVGNYLAAKWGSTWSPVNEIDIIQRGAAHSTPGAGTGTTISVTPTAGGAGHLYLCAVGGTYNCGGGVSTLTGGGLTWSKVRDNASGASMVSIWQATGTLTTATVTATYTSGSNAYMRHIAVCEIIGTTAVGQQAYTAASPTGASSLGVTMGEFGAATNRVFAAAASFHTNDGTSSILLSGDYVELDFLNGYDSLMEAGGGAYFGWVTGWSPNTQDDPSAYDQTGYGNQYIAITAVELGTPWAQGPGHSTIVSSDNIQHRGGNDGRTIDYCQNGNLWTVLYDDSAASGSLWKFYYSTNQGATWTESVSSRVGATSEGLATSFFIDKDDYAHQFCTYSTGSFQARYRLGTPNGSRTAWSWGTPIDYTPSGGGSHGHPMLDVVAYRGGRVGNVVAAGQGWTVHLFWSNVNASNYTNLNWTELRLKTDHTVDFNTTATLSSPFNTQEPYVGSMDFRHDITDPKAVQASTPSVYLTWTTSDGNLGLYFQKLTWTGTGHSQGTIRTIDSSSQNTSNLRGAGPQLVYDGTRVLLMHVRESATEVWVEERDEADTTTSLLGNGENVDAGFISGATIGYDAAQNIYLYARGYPGYDWKKSIYTRSATSWSSWSLDEQDDSYGSDVDACLMRGPEGPVPLGVVYRVRSPSPDQVRFASLVTATAIPVPPYEGWGSIEMALVDPPQSKTVSDTAVASDSANVVGPLPTEGLKGWYDFSVTTSNLWQDSARTSPVTTNGQPIGGVTDKSGKGNHLSAVTGNTPDYTTAVINGRSVARFNGSSDMLGLGTAWASDTDYTVIVVAQKRTAVTSVGETLFHAVSPSATLITDSSFGTGYTWGKNQASSFVHLGGTPTNVNCVVLRVNSDTFMDAYINGGVANTFDPNAAVSPNTNFYLGIGDAGSVEPGGFDIGEVLIYDYPLSDIDMNKVGAYLAGRWGFTWTTINPLAVHLDFSDISTLWQNNTRTTAITADGQEIQGVTDKSGKGNHFVGNGAGAAPTYKTAQINSKSIARFDGSNDTMVQSGSLASVLSGYNTIFLVLKKATAPTSASKYVLTTAGNGSIRTNTTTGVGYIYDTNNALSAQVLGGTPANTNILVLAYTGPLTNQMKNYLNGGVSVGTFNPADDFIGSANFFLASNAGTSNFGDWDIAEVQIHTESLALGDIQAIGSALATKWGTTWIDVTPTMVAGLKGWWDFSNISSLYQDTARTSPITADAQTILGVTDLSGTAHHLQVSVSPNGPAYKTGIINGRSVARFDGTDDRLVSTSFAQDTNWTMFFVVKKRSAPSATNQVVWGKGTNGTIRTSSGSATSWRGFSDVSAAEFSIGINATNLNCIVMQVQTAGLIDFRANGGSITSSVNTGSDWSSNSTMDIGGGGSQPYFSDSDICEILCYDSIMSAGNANIIGRWLAAKWGFTWTDM